MLDKIKYWWAKQQAGRVARTLGVEFALSLALAVGLYVYGVTSTTVAAWREAAFGFFMIAFFTGQWVRVRRKIERRDSAAKTLQNMEDLNSALARHVAEIIGHTTAATRYRASGPQPSTDSPIGL